jgi:hypothetical protein
MFKLDKKSNSLSVKINWKETYHSDMRCVLEIMDLEGKRERHGKPSTALVTIHQQLSLFRNLHGFSGYIKEICDK